MKKLIIKTTIAAFIFSTELIAQTIGIPNETSIQKNGTVWLYPEFCSGVIAAPYTYNGHVGILSASGRCSLNSRNSDRTWFLDISAMKFQELGRLPQGFGWAATGYVDGAVYAFGGLVLDVNGRSEVMRFDENGWNTVGYMTRARAFQGATIVDGKAYLIGGQSVGTISNDPTKQWDVNATTASAEVYDLDTNTSHLIPSIPGLSRGWNYVAAYDGYIYSFGGVTFEGLGEAAAVSVPDAWRYSIANNNWERLADLPYPLGGGTAVVANNKICLVGGARERRVSVGFGSYSGPQGNLQLQHDILCYDPSAQSYSTIGQIPMPVNNPGVAYTQGLFWLMGGENKSDVLGNKINLFQIISNQ